MFSCYGLQGILDVFNLLCEYNNINISLKIIGKRQDFGLESNLALINFLITYFKTLMGRFQFDNVCLLFVFMEWSCTATFLKPIVLPQI